MAEYTEKFGEVEVPKNVGIKGFLRALEEVLKLPRVQSIEIDARGKILFRHAVREGDAPALNVDFTSLLPSSVIRNSNLSELHRPSTHAATALGQLFAMAAVDHLYPVAFVGGANTMLWDWYATSTNTGLASREEVFGVPFLADRFIEDHVLVLCATYVRAASLIDTQASYKLSMR